MAEVVLNEKQFLTYSQQIEKLKGKKLVIEDEVSAKNILMVTSYYSLISGYKDIFKKEDGSKDYKKM